MALAYRAAGDRGDGRMEVETPLDPRTGARVHNDSTTVSFRGQYKTARGRSIRSKSAPLITLGHSKARRPDLKQLLCVLTCSGDGYVPVGFRCEAGNTNDSPTHIETWDALVKLTGGVDFFLLMDATVGVTDDASRSHCERLLYETPTSLESAVALMASRPAMRWTMRVLNPVVYDVI